MRRTEIILMNEAHILIFITNQPRLKFNLLSQRVSEIV